MIDYDKPTKGIIADHTGVVECSKDNFEDSEGDSCFCGNGTVSNFCDWNLDYKIDLGCYKDSQFERDFEELLSSEITSVEGCLKLAFDNYMSYAGL